MSGKQYQVPFTPWRLDLLGVVWNGCVQPYVWEAVPGFLYALKTRLTWCCVGQACPALCLGSSTKFPLHREDKTYLVLCGTGVSSSMSGKQYQIPFTPWRQDLLGDVWDGRVQPYVWEAVPGSLFALKTRLTWHCVRRACLALCLGSSTRFPLRPED